MTRKHSSPLCPCGRMLHYPSPELREVVERIIARKGPLVEIAVEDGLSYLVPRHYIALHGVSAAALPQLAARYGWAQAEPDALIDLLAALHKRAPR